MTSTIWCWDEKFLASIFFSRNWSFGGAGIFLTRDSRSRRQKLLPEVGLFLGSDPWQRGKRLDLCRKP